MKSIYIAGPMRHYPQYNHPAFNKAQALWEDKGYHVMNPVKMEEENGFVMPPDDHDWSQDSNVFGKDTLLRDLEAVVSCEAIYMLKGWEASRGAQAEYHVALWSESEIHYEQNEDILEEALRITSGDRQADYGPPDQDFMRTAIMWTGYLWPNLTQELKPRDVASMMILLKQSRNKHQAKRDNWVDTAGYARCGQICMQEEAKRENLFT